MQRTCKSLARELELLVPLIFLCPSLSSSSPSLSPSSATQVSVLSEQIILNISVSHREFYLEVFPWLCI